MNDKTIFKIDYDQPIHKGMVIKYDREKMKGIISSDKGDDIFFKYSCSENELIQVGDNVIFRKQPFIQTPNRYYAKNIKKAYVSKNGYLVSEEKKSHVHADLRKELPSVIERISCVGRDYIYENLRFENIKGMSACVPITWEDEIIFAVRVGRDKYSKFVKNRETIPTNNISIFLQKKQDIYLIKSCYYGEFRADADLYDFENTGGERTSFWNDHALVFESEPIYPETITSVCPWTGINENNRFGSIFTNINSASMKKRA